MMRKIALFGTVGYNLGDEAVAVAAARALKDLDPVCTVFISTANKGAIAGRYAGVREFYLDRKSPWGWLRLVAFIAGVDLVVIGGGTLIQDKLGMSRFKGMIPYVHQIASIARQLHKNVVSLPIGIDRLTTAAGRTLAEKTLNQINRLYVRDETSAMLARRYGYRRPVHVSADPAFLIQAPRLDPGYGHYVTISLARENLDTGTFMPAVIETVGALLQHTDRAIVFVPMERRQADELALFTEIMCALKDQGLTADDRLPVITSSAAIGRHRLAIVDPNQAVSLHASVLRRADLLIAMRLHAAILSLGYTNIIGISRTTKTETLFQEFATGYFDITRAKIDPAALQARAFSLLDQPVDARAFARIEEKKAAVRRSLAELLEQQ